MNNIDSYTSAEKRDKILQDIARTSHRDLDDELRRRHAEIKDEFTKEQSKMQEDFKNEKTHVKELLYEQFNQAVRRLKESIEKGDYDGEVAHRMTADWLNSELKKRGY
jgi:anthranilate/para-aminobenzoate synthase component I